jgi:hypothetical protein
LRASADRDSIFPAIRGERAMMGERQGSQDRLFYEFCLEDRVPSDHLLRKIDAVLDLSWLRAEAEKKT